MLTLGATRQNDANAGWRMCNSACVGANHIERNCDFVRWQSGWRDCHLRRWIDAKSAETIDKMLDVDPTNLHDSEVMFLLP